MPRIITIERASIDSAGTFQPPHIPGPNRLILGLVTETDTPFALTGRKTVQLGAATETDTPFALHLQKRIGLGLATETDTAYAFTARKTIQLGIATETDTPFSIRSAHLLTLGPAIETDTPQPLHTTKIIRLGLATETDSPYPLAFPAALFVTGTLLTHERNVLLAFSSSQPMADAKIWGAVDATADAAVQTTEGASSWISFPSSRVITLANPDGAKALHIKGRNGATEYGPVDLSIYLDQAYTHTLVYPHASLPVPFGFSAQELQFAGSITTRDALVVSLADAEIAAQIYFLHPSTGAPTRAFSLSP